MKKNRFKHIFINLFPIFLCVFLGHPSMAQNSTEDIWEKGVRMTKQSYENHDFTLFLEGLKLMETSFKKKNTASKCYEIGSLYYYLIPFGDNGNLIYLDREKGLKWFEKGAKLGDMKSALVLYKEYRPKEKPYSILAPQKEWKEYFKVRDKSWKYAGIALQADIPSNFDDYVTLGDAAWFTHNDDLAHQYFAKAADNGEYGNPLEYVIRDERALDYLTSPKAMYDAGILMWRRGKDNDIYGHHDSENGLKMYEKSAKLGYAQAQKQMGYIYLTGQIVEPDTLKAVSWYKLAAKQNHTDVPFLLGKLYANGKGIDKDTDKAFEYFKESADSGYVYSELPLAYCYLYGLGTSKDMNKAREYFQAYFARLKHAPEARLYQSGTFIMDLDYLLGLTYYFVGSPQAISLFEASLKNDTFYHSQRADLLYKLSSCYNDGICGVTIDTSKAEDYNSFAHEYGTSEISIENIEF